MREILFRGKRTDNGEWVEGFYLIKKDPLFSGVEYHYILIQEKDNCGCLMPHVTWAKVIPKTVGQYIGLTDKNGIRIFEGDIVAVETEDEYGKIAYSDNEAMYNIELGTWCADFDHFYEKDCEVIGNIHDNPELLEV